MSLANYLSLPRLLSGLMLTAGGQFCVFGLMASFEVAPRDRTPWLIGYGFLALCLFASAMRLGLTSFGSRRTIQRQGIVGLVLGSLIAFLAIFLLCLFGPNGEHLGPLSGLGFGLFFAPFGGGLGGIGGTCLGLKSGKASAYKP